MKEIFHKKIYINIKNKREKIAIAFSGGVDSSVLLNICKKYFNKNKIFIIHINHNISKNSLNWKEECKKISKKNKCIFLSKNIHLKNKNIKKKGIEGEARRLRYKSIIKIAEAKKIKNVFLAHNLDDQIETFILRLLRGSSNIGIECMKELTKFKNIKIFRPILNFEREYIINKIKFKDKYIVDESNKDTKIRRNFIRYILEKIKGKFPFYKKTILKFMENNLKNNEIIEKISNNDYKKTKMKTKNIKKLNYKRRINLISFFLRKNLIKITSKEWLDEIDKQILSGKNFIIKKQEITLFKKKNKLCVNYTR
ncbi:tRNA lysidine(34) synthetase TilS [Candidatus Vidania fulgoroideorum]